jgi:hypothetical protein
MPNGDADPVARGRFDATVHELSGRLDSLEHAHDVNLGRLRATESALAADDTDRQSITERLTDLERRLESGHAAEQKRRDRG